jgi:hypothetical protein
MNKGQTPDQGALKNCVEFTTRNYAALACFSH